MQMRAEYHLQHAVCVCIYASVCVPHVLNLEQSQWMEHIDTWNTWNTCSHALVLLNVKKHE